MKQCRVSGALRGHLPAAAFKGALADYDNKVQKSLSKKVK